MPGDGLALTIRVSREIEGFRVLQRANDGLDVLLVALDDLVLHREAVFRVDGALLGHEVADVAVGSHDIEVLAEVLADGLGFRRRFDDDEILRHAVLGARFVVAHKRDRA